MGDNNYRILLVEDCKRGLSEIYSDFIFSEYHNLHINLVTSVADVEHRLKSESFSAILLASALPNYDGTSLVNYIKKISGGTPLIVSLNSQDADRIADVKRIEVEKIYYDNNISIKEIDELCARFEKDRKKNAPVAAAEKPDKRSVSHENESQQIKNSQISYNVQKEVKKHKEALEKARKESESSREAEEIARKEALKLREQAETAKKEAETVKKKIEELKQQNAEQSKIIEQSKHREEVISQEVDSDRQNYDNEKKELVREKDELTQTRKKLNQELENRDMAINHLHDEIAKLRRDVEHVTTEKNELQRRFDDSENKRNVLLKDTQDAHNTISDMQEEAIKSADEFSMLEKKLGEALVERDKALESSRIAGEYSGKAERERDQAIENERKETEVRIGVEKLAAELAEKIDNKEKMISNLNQVVESLELRCEELEAGQAALIEAEHVGIQREREGREKAESELTQVKGALGELENIERERAKLEELLKDGQSREQEIIHEKTRELESSLAREKESVITLQDKLNSVKGQLETKNKEAHSLKNSNDRLERELAEKAKTVTGTEARILEYKNTLNELETQHAQSVRDYQQRIGVLEDEVKSAENTEQKLGELEEKVKSLKEENDNISLEKKEVMESYANKAEAIQERLDKSEAMLKDCEWKLESEVSLKDLALERVMELGAFEDQVAQLEVELAEKDSSLRSMQITINSQKEQIDNLSTDQVHLKDKVQLENLEKDMALDKLKAELEALKTEYQEYKQSILKEKEMLADNASGIQDRLSESGEKLKSALWEISELEKERDQLKSRIAELDAETALLGDLHQEISDLKDDCAKAEKKSLLMTEENETLLEKVESYRAMVQKLDELEVKADLADRVAQEIDELNKAFQEEQIEHRRLEVELRKASERESHLEELKASNKELGWELMKARSLIGEYMARDEERAILGNTESQAEIDRLEMQLAQKDAELDSLNADKERFAREQLDKVAELTELYEKAQTERLELLERLNRNE